METINLLSWDEFRVRMEEVRAKYGRYQVAGGFAENCILFRGQANSNWSLKTTLERYTDSKFTIERYESYALASTNEIESFTGKKWELSNISDVAEEIEAKKDDLNPPLRNYDYLVYLRHHGFPSPLLDWTESPFIAAYFAFAEKQDSDRVAIFAFIERLRGIKSIDIGTPQITVKGPYVTTDSRHFAQKAMYTVATQKDARKKIHTFCNHEWVFAQGRKNQDILIKFTLPSKDRIKALRELGDYNINHFTLFQTEDSLVRTMALKIFELGKL